MLTQGACEVISNHIVIVAGRCLVAFIFIIAGLMFFRAADFAFAESVIAAHGLPFPALLLVGTMIIQLACGLMMVIGWKVNWAATILLVWLVPATWMFHPFWAATGPEVPNQTFHFLKNVAIAGALLLIAASSGPSWQRPSDAPAP
jgi:putative oxidoreductase